MGLRARQKFPPVEDDLLSFIASGWVFAAVFFIFSLKLAPVFFSPARADELAPSPGIWFPTLGPGGHAGRPDLPAIGDQISLSQELQD
jgi:hypothetical protein